jgi:hypothetical protein
VDAGIDCGHDHEHGDKAKRMSGAVWGRPPLDTDERLRDVGGPKGKESNPNYENDQTK